MLVYGVEMPDMNDKNFMPLDMILVIKGLNEDGTITYREMASNGLAPMERLGMAVSYADTIRSVLMRGSQER
jgi:hypothetical protein